MRNSRTLLGLAICLTLPTIGLAQDTGVTFRDIPWIEGPVAADIGQEARIAVPDGCLFTGMDGVRQFMELTENPVDGSERAVVFCEDEWLDETNVWFVVFSFSRSGYVRDDDRDRLDADALLASIREGTAESNKERVKRGWDTLAIGGWVTPPFYDPKTNNLTWALFTLNADGSTGLNHSVRLLGRNGVMHVDLVAEPSQLERLLPTFTSLVSSFEYLPGQRYSEWRSGDKVATYGLTALVAGGAGAVAAQTGLLAKLWKLVVGAIVALFAGLKSFWARITGRREE